MLSYWTGYTPYFIRDGKVAITEKKQRNKGEIIRPLEQLDFNQGTWSAYITLSYGDYQNIKSKVSRNCLRLTNIETLNQMREEWEMVYTDGDLATVSSQIVFLKDNKIVLIQGIILPKNGQDGLQSSAYGFLEPQHDDIIWKYVNKFEPVFWPLIILQ